MPKHSCIYVLIISFSIFESSSWNPFNGNDWEDIGEQTADTAEDLANRFRGLFEIGDIPYIDEIPSISSQVNNIPTIVAQTNKIPNIIDDVSSMESQIMGQINTVISTIEDITNILDPSVLMSLPTDGDTEDMKSTLQTCIADLSSLSLANVIDTIGDVIQTDIDLPSGFNFNVGDITDVPLGIVAKALTPIKDVINLFCGHVVPTAVSIVRDLISMVDEVGSELTRRRLRRRLTDDGCNSQSGLCQSQDLSSYIANDEGIYASIIDTFSDTMFPNGISAASDGNLLASWRFAVMIMDPVGEVIDKTCTILSEIELPYFMADLAVTAACQMINMQMQTGLIIINNFIGFADFHDGMIADAQNNAILQNTKNIITNQQTSWQSSMLLQQPGEWVEGLTLGSDNSYDGVVIDIGESFNQIFANTQYHIIKRECSACGNTDHRVIYYRRLQNADSFDAYGYMKVWRSENNVLGTDFNLYSTLEDAIANTNAWQYCDYDDTRVGAFRNCGPSISNGGQWTADVPNGGLDSANAAKFSIYVEAPDVHSVKDDITQIMLLLHQNQDWLPALTLGSDNSYDGVAIDIGDNFNHIFANTQYHIIKRECSACGNTDHRVIYYRRLQNADSFDVYGYMKVWRSENNVLGTDFNLYSTLDDALANTNAWQYCDYDDTRVGAFRNCGPSISTGGQWTADVPNGGLDSANSAKFSIYVGAPDSTQSVELYPLNENWNGDHTLVITVSSSHLYIIGMFVIGFIVVFNIFGVFVVVKCCYGDHTSGTYKYKRVNVDSESELDAVN